MTFIDYLNQMSRLARQYRLTASERGLYVTILNEFNACHWSSFITITDNQFCGELGIGKRSLDSMRNRLKQVGLIDFISARGKRVTKYYLADVIDAETHNKRNNKRNNKVHNKCDNNRDNKRESHIIYRKDKDKDIYTSTDVDVVEGTSSATTTLKKEILKEIDILKGDREWLDSLQTACRRPQGEILEEITFFGAHCISYDRRHSSISDAKRHFCDWLRKRPSQKSSKNGITSDNTYGTFRPFYGKPQLGCGLIE